MYKNNEAPIACEPHKEPGRLLSQIHELQFAALELQLYLDTHPEDTNAISMYNQYHTDLVRCVSEYETHYGPLLSYGFSPSPPNRWGWLDGPWPWEVNY